jgi:drug/metabolite transporter (DMT)-like permease
MPLFRVRLRHAAWPVLALANLLWAGNIMPARGAGGCGAAGGTGAFLLALPFAWSRLRRDIRLLLRHWRMMLLLSATGIASYNTLSYIALTKTTALNVLLLQSAAPLVILVWAFLLFGDRPSLRQSTGVAVSLAGVVTIAARGSLSVMVHLRLNPGDAIIVLALCIYSIYCVIFRRRPAVHPVSFLVGHRLVHDPTVLFLGTGFWCPHRRGCDGMARTRLRCGVPFIRCLSVVQPRHRADRPGLGRPIHASDATVR